MRGNESQPGRSRPDGISRRSLQKLSRSIIPISPDVIGGPYKNVISTGIDMCEVRFAERVIAQTGPDFLPAVLTEEEIAYCQAHGRKQAQHFAGMFAAKEAIYKTLEETLGGAWHEIHIDHNEKGAPVVRLEGKVQERAQELGIVEMRLSITHERSAAVAICIGVGNS